MPFYANLRGQIKKLPWSHPQPFNPPYATPPPSAYHGGSETSYVHGEQYARVETAFISVHYSSSARYRSRLCAADSEDESITVKEGSSRTNTLDLEPGAQLCDLLRAKDDAKGRLR
jgi:hypothetical protein